MNTSSIMTKDLITISHQESLEQARQLMEQKNIQHLAVVDEAENIVGILSSKDLPKKSHFEELKVEHFMSSPVYHINQNMPLRSAIYKLLENKISALLVTDESGAAIGIITTTDLLGHLAQMVDAEPKNHPTLKQYMDVQTLGQIANQISMVGI